MKLKLDHESANALREFADAMPFAIENITESTEKLVKIYNSVAENIGPHYQDFHNMLMLIKSVQMEALEPVEVLPAMLKTTADKIDNYIGSHENISGN